MCYSVVRKICELQKSKSYVYFLSYFITFNLISMLNASFVLLCSSLDRLHCLCDCDLDWDWDWDCDSDYSCDCVCIWIDYVAFST